jgi:hypothetical protein
MAAGYGVPRQENSESATPHGRRPQAICRQTEAGRWDADGRGRRSEKPGTDRTARRWLFAPIAHNAFHAHHEPTAMRPYIYMLGKKFIYSSVLILTVGIFSGCSQERINDHRCNLIVSISRDFVNEQSKYYWWPSKDESIYRNINFSGNVGINISGNGRGDLATAVVELSIVVAVVLVMTTADATVHNLHGVDIDLIISGSNQVVITSLGHLGYGENKFLIPNESLDGLKDGSMKLEVVGTGTRKFCVQVPTYGVEFGKGVNHIELASYGKIIVNGKAP